MSNMDAAEAASHRGPRLGDAGRLRRRLMTPAALVVAIASLGLLATSYQPASASGSAGRAGGAPSPAQRARSQPRAVAGWILRIYKNHHKGYLRFVEMTGPDAPSLNPPYPRCMLRHRAGQRVVNFDLNWSDINMSVGGPTPAVRLTIVGPHGEQMIAVVPVDDDARQVCRPVHSFRLGVLRRNWQEVLGLVMRLPVHQRLRELTVTVDGHTKRIRMIRVCHRVGCFSDNPPVLWQLGTPYSVSIRV
jgi:hypothetical protein